MFHAACHVKLTAVTGTFEKRALGIPFHRATQMGTPIVQRVRFFSDCRPEEPNARGCNMNGRIRLNRRNHI